jgi:hypothetical protein
MVSNDAAVITEFMKELNTHLKSTTFEEKVMKYLGMDIAFEGQHVHLSQQTYIQEKMNDLAKSSRSCPIPISDSLNLRRATPNEENESLLPVTGKLRYLADRCRPDILTAVGEISTGGAHSPSDEHVRASESCVTFILQTIDLVLKLGGVGVQILFAFSDANYITEGNSKSRLGGCLFYGYDSGACYSFSKNDSTISHSSMGSEIRALDMTIRSVIYYRLILAFLNRAQVEPTTIYVDNKSMVEMMKTLKSGHKTKHINVMINYIRETINSRQIQLQFIRSHQNVADILTKNLGKVLFHAHQENLMHGFKGKFTIDPEPASSSAEEINYICNHLSFLS